MKIKYLGTAASEGVPGIYCNCEFCKYARKTKGKELRSRAQAVIDGDLLIDFGPDTYQSAIRFDIDLSAIKHYLITHTHEDHFAPLDLASRGPGYAVNIVEKKVSVYGSENVKRRFEAIFEGKISKFTQETVSFVTLNTYERTQIGDYFVTPLKADHMPSELTFVYIIEKNGKTILYCNDTGINFKDNLEFLKNCSYKYYFDFIGFDCTYVTKEGKRPNGHLTMEMAKELLDSFKEIGVADEKTVSMVTHFSHHYMMPHEELEKVAKQYGFIAAYDGIEIQV